MLCGALMATAWAFFVRVAALQGPVGPAWVVVVPLVCFSTALTWWAAQLVAREWWGRFGRLAAAPVSGLATLSIVLLALLELSAWVGVFYVGLLFLVVLLVALGIVARAIHRTLRYVSRRYPRSPRNRARDARLAEKALEARAAKEGYRG